MINVYAWPPVGVLGHEWTESAPIQRSRSLLTGKDYISAYARKRRMVTIETSSLSLNRSGAGYVEMLKRYLDGGIHAVRLYSYPINWWLDSQLLQSERQSELATWEEGVDEVDWESESDPVQWYTGTVITGDVLGSSGSRYIQCSGLPANQLIARPGDFVTAYEGFDPNLGQTSQLIREAVSDGSGNATLYLFDDIDLMTAARVNIGTSSTGVFRVEEMPRAVQPLNSNWGYTWSFREIFSDEVGGFTEVNPWG